MIKTEFSGRVIGKMIVANYIEEEDLWYVIVEDDEGIRTVRKATYEDLKLGNEPKNVIRALSKNPYIHNADNTTTLFDIRGREIIIDTLNFELLRSRLWVINNQSKLTVTTMRCKNIKGKVSSRSVYLHRYLTDTVSIGRKVKVSYIDGNKANNTMENLIVDNTKVYPGINKIKGKDRYSVKIRVDGHKVYLGCSTTLEEALKLQEDGRNRYSTI